MTITWKFYKLIIAAKREACVLQDTIYSQDKVLKPPCIAINSKKWLMV